MSTGPLHGVRVLELAGIGPGPMACRLLAELGAEVVRVTRPSQPGDFAEPVSLRGRREITLDLKSPEGVATFLALVERADVVIDPYRPGVVERLGIGPEDCLGRNPRVVYGRMTGWGQDGPWARVAGHDINYLSVTGALEAIGEPEGPPQIPLNLLGDFGGGSLYLLTGILAALHERSVSGRGQVVDAAIVDGVASLSGFIHGLRGIGAWGDGRGVNLLDGGAPFYDVYRTADDRWMAVGALEPQFYAELVRLLELTDLPDQHDRARWPELRERLSARFAERTQQEWAGLFAGTEACVSPVLTWAEAVEHPQVGGRGTLTEVDGTVVPAPAPRFSRSTTSVPSPAREAGADTEAVLRDWGVGANG